MPSILSESGVELRTSYIFAACAFIALFAASSAGSPSSSLRSFISAYMSNATISQFSFYNLSVNGSNYIVAVSANGTTYLAISSNGGKYSLVSNASAINPVLTEYFAQYENLSAVSYLSTAMRKYTSGFGSNLSDCLQETGINPPYTNTFNNAVQNCQSTPICNQVITSLNSCDVYGTNGCEHPSPFAGGLQNLSIAYGAYNASLKSYFSVVQGINASNAGDSIARLGTYISNISAFSAAVSTNPLFPPPESVNFASCSGTGLPYQQPWYCSATGYCGYMYFNSSLLSSISSTQQQLGSIIPSKSGIVVYSSASAKAASGYIVAANARANAPSYYAFLNSTYPEYNSIVASALTLLTKSNNANLSTELEQLNASFKAILSNGINVSIASETSSFNSVLARFMESYNAANQSFAESSSYSSNYTIEAIAAQLNYRRVPPRLAQLSSQLQATDLKLSSNANSSEVEAAIPELRVIGVQLGVYVPITTIGYLIKLADGWFINAMLAGSNTPVQAKISAAPAYAALLSLIIGLIILLIFYLLTHRRLSKHHKIRHSHKTRIAWMTLFAVLFVLVLLYTYGTYAYAKAANNFLPFSYFTGYLHASKSAYIVLNGSATYTDSGVVSCASAISSVLASQGKTVQTIQATNYSCVAGGTVSSLGVDCIDRALSSGTPVISLSQSGSDIVYKGLYGTMLYASGANATGSSCIVAQLLSRK
ncbi:MAG: hypothetical protein KGH94_03125 [Candidatus Micrarchaeota archaeon]|nr:hypothetical protein [Candidatus Micrarchaeota archaeon]